MAPSSDRQVAVIAMISENLDPIRVLKSSSRARHSFWLFKENPEGMFAPTNPAVNCAGYPYALDVDSTKMVMSGMDPAGNQAHQHPGATTVVKSGAKAAKK